MVTESGHRIAAARQPLRQAMDPGAEKLSKRPCHAMPEADAAALSRVVEEAGQVHGAIIHSRVSQGRHDVEPVPAIRGGHRVEEGELGRRQPLDQRGALHGTDPCRDVPAELARLTCPPGD
jgi:hypothetical protein